MTKTITYIGFAISSILIVLAFITAKTYTQLVIAVILYPLLAYFALKLFPRSQNETPAIAYPVPTIAPYQPPNTYQTNINNDKVEIVDIDKRTFLKLLGTAGISFFVFSILGRRSEDFIFNNQFTNSLPQNNLFQNGKEIQPDTLTAEGYRISEIDDDIVSYYGFTNKTGYWLIMREDSQNNSFRYAKGEDNFSKNWERRQMLKYDYYYNLF